MFSLLPMTACLVQLKDPVRTTLLSTMANCRRGGGDPVPACRQCRLQRARLVVEPIQCQHVGSPDCKGLTLWWRWKLDLSVFVGIPACNRRCNRVSQPLPGHYQTC